MAISIVLLLSGSAFAQTGGTFDLVWNTIDGGGGGSSGGAFMLRGTIGQPDAGTATGGTYTLNCGFLADGAVSDAACPGEGDCCTPNVTRGCASGACCESICALDPFCCETQWYADCADADIFGTPASPCAPNGEINFDDVLAVLNAFSGNPPCPCG